MKFAAQRAFTLVELSIVLVILGLLVGGILVGQDLIHGSSVKKQITQIEQYRTSMNSFRDKYHGIPGDLRAATANGFGMIARAGTAGHGDGSGLIDGCVTNGRDAGCETLLYWTDLSFAGMLTPTLNTATDAAATITAATLNQYLPLGSLGSTAITVFTDGSMNYFQLTNVTSATAGVYSLAPTLTPMDAFNIDEKLDDGNPLDGSTRAMGGTGPLGVIAVPGAADCVNTTTGNPYNTIGDAATTPLCQLRVRI